MEMCEVDCLTHRTLIDLMTTSSTTEQDFRLWLIQRGKSEKSAKNYSEAISTTLSILGGKDLYGVRSAKQTDELIQELVSADSFVELNRRGKGMYQAALNHYKEFRSIGTDMPLTTHSIAFTPFPDPLWRNLTLSLLTKPFTILTGASGTGKTKLAESLATYFGDAEGENHCVVPVGADWTDNRHVLGFVNHLREDGTGDKNPIYQTTPILDFLLSAVKNKNAKPYFLILDEMNLSHVERYFSDFLSVMEQKDGVFHLHDEGKADTRLLRSPEDKLGVPRTLPYPLNLFVIGTVNIDETTYMFSPKVLDRANVIEFKVDAGNIEKFLDSPGGYPETHRAEGGVAETFLELSLKARNNGLESLPTEVGGVVKAHILALFELMEAGRFEFAYRTVNEVIRYLIIAHDLADDKAVWENDEWKKDLDDQILQKILPKLHGSTGRISALLVNLVDYCRTGVLPAERSAPTRLKDIAAMKVEAGGFKNSFKKLKAMASTLQSEQFVSFIQ